MEGGGADETFVAPGEKFFDLGCCGGVCREEGIHREQAFDSGDEAPPPRPRQRNFENVK